MALEKFMFVANGKEYFIPHASQIPSGLLRKVRKLDQVDATFSILEELLGIDSPELAALDTMPMGEMNKFIQDWTQGASLGESQGSSK